MIVGEVIGNVWATRKDENLNGFKLMVVKPIPLNEDRNANTFVAVDSVGAGIGEKVLVVNGSSARVSLQKTGLPIDAVIVGIIDSIEIDSMEN